MSMSIESGDIISNGHMSAPMKTLWFEFLLQPKSLETHLNNENADPSAIDLIIQFMTNAFTYQSPPGGGMSSVPYPNVNGNGVNTPIDDESNMSMVQSQLMMQKKEEIDTKKSMAIKLLALKVTSHLKWDIETLETRLPVTMTDNVLNEFNRFCEINNAPPNCKLFACILHFRWILRFIMKSRYPTRGPKGPTIPFVLQQQIDPCFVSQEAFDNLMKKLMEQMEMAVNDLEKLICERKKGTNVEISMPNISCFTLKDNSIDNYNWDNAIKLNTSDVIDDILYDLGRWFFFNEDYSKSNEYFEGIALTQRDRFNHLNDYLISTRELKSDSPNDNNDVEIIDISQQIKESVEQLMNGHTCDISVFDNIIDVKDINNSIHSAYKNHDTDLQRTTLKRLTKYLTNRVKGLRDHINTTIFDKNDYEKESNEKELNEKDIDAEMMEEGEIITDEDMKDVKDHELALLEATDPELIQSLVCKVQKHPLLINHKWNLPVNQTKLLINISQSQYEKCHIILAKAFQLRDAKLFIESRTLYLSLLEDVQASLPQLADVIRWELLRTDLENHFDSTDVDERKIIDLIGKCGRTLITIDKSIAIEFPELTELCCVFLLESCPSSLKELSNSQVPIINFAACLSNLRSDQSSSATNACFKQLWDLLLNAFFISQNNAKKTQMMQTLSSLSVSSIISFVSKLKDTTLITIILSCISKLHNLVRDVPTLELSVPPSYSVLWPLSLGSLSASIDLNAITLTLSKLLNKFLDQNPLEINWIKFKAELCSIESNFSEALKYFISALMISTKYFTAFSVNYVDEDAIIHKMIQCCVKLGCHTQAAVLHQMTKEPNYGLAFKALCERNCNDSCDDIYECIWDITLLEYLINLHARRCEIERKIKVIQLIGQLELNASNYENVLRESADVRRGKFMRILTRTYL